MNYTSTAEVGGYLSASTKGASAAFAVLFTISSILHIFQNSKYKSWFVLWLLPCASVILTAGFICLDYNAYKPQNDSTFTASQGLLFSGVPIISASLYTLLSRLIATQPQLSPFRPYVLGFIFICLISAIISLTAQGASSFFSPTAPHSSAKAGLALLQASLVLQLFFNVVFIGILAVFHRRCFTAKVFHEGRDKTMKPLAFTLYASATLILVRNIFRTVQLFSPLHSPAWKVEAFFWIFDATPLLICTLVLNFWHPGKFHLP